MEGKKEALEALKQKLLENEAYKHKIEIYEFTSPNEISHYTEYNFEMKSENLLFSCDFEIYGKDIPREQFELFAERQVIKAGGRGTIQSDERGIFVGKLEGEKQAIENIQEELSNSYEFMACIDKCIFSEMKPMEKYTTSKFTRISLGSQAQRKKLFSCDFEIAVENIPNELIVMLSDAHTALWSVRGIMHLTTRQSFKGTFESDMETIEKIREVLYLLKGITPIKYLTMGACCEILGYSTDKFEIYLDKTASKL